MTTSLQPSHVCRSLTPDGRLLFVTRCVRLFANGFLAVVLVLYLREVGLSEWQVPKGTHGSCRRFS